MWGYLSDPFQYPFMQRALLEVLLLSVPAGLLGCWIVLRRLSFLTHAVGAATFPGLVLGFGLGFSPWLGAFGVAGGSPAHSRRSSAARSSTPGAITGLLLATALAAGSVLVSDVFHSSARSTACSSGASSESATTTSGARARARRCLHVAVVLVAGRGLLAVSFAPDTAASLGYRRGCYDAGLLLLLGAAVVSSSAAIGGFVVSGLLVVPAATARLLARSVLQLQLGGAPLAAVEAAAGPRARLPARRPARRRHRGARRVGLPGRRAGSRRAASAPSRRRLAVAALAWPGGPGRRRLRHDAPTPARPARGAVRVVATTTQLQDLVRNVGGSRVRVTGILKPNVDPHEYEPRPSDAVGLTKARLVVESGAGLDAWMGTLIDQAGTDTRVWVASSGLKLRPGDAEEPQGDPHWWHDPDDFARAATALARRARQGRPGRQGGLRGQRPPLRGRDPGDGRGQPAPAARSCPSPQRRLVTNHDAFAYLAAHYHITIVGSVLRSLSTAAEPSARDIAALVNKIRAPHVRAIFTETSVNPKLEQQIAREAGVQVYANLYGDTLGPPGSKGDTYLHMERWNVTVIVDGLLGRPIPA